MEYEEDSDKIFNETFKPFLNRLSEWISDGCNKDDIFYKGGGICDNYSSWLMNCDVHPHTIGIIVFVKNLPEIFESDGLDKEYPFNCGDNDDFREERYKKTMYENEKRLAWIAEKANEKF